MGIWNSTLQNPETFEGLILNIIFLHPMWPYLERAVWHISFFYTSASLWFFDFEWLKKQNGVQILTVQNLAQLIFFASINFLTFWNGSHAISQKWYFAYPPQRRFSLLLASSTVRRGQQLPKHYLYLHPILSCVVFSLITPDSTYYYPNTKFLNSEAGSSYSPKFDLCQGPVKDTFTAQYWTTSLLASFIPKLALHWQHR